MPAFDPDLPKRLDELMARHVETGETGGVAWLACRDDEVVAGSAGVLTRGEATPVASDSLFRVASNTKPLTAVAALLLVEECRLRLDVPVDELLPELADRRVLVDPLGPIDGETVPAERPITVRDLLTMQCGLGMDFTAPWPQPLFDRMAELGLGPGAPEPGATPEPDEWMRRLGTLPLVRQPGERWLYHTASDIVGVLVARAAGQPFDRFLQERVLDPLGMSDTGFATTATDRLGTSYSVDGGTGERTPYDAPDGRWSRPPAFPSGAGGLVSTVDDLAAFGRMLLEGGRLPDGSRLLSRAAVDAMTTDQLGVAGGHPGITPNGDGSTGWGFGVGVQVRRTGLIRSVGSYGWDGGLGSSWINDPAERLVGVVLSTDMFAGDGALPRPLADFWTTVYAAVP
ncbi:MAG TPA: serine hydrolase domain-containing protein [Acidimicrobiales bacterium]|nr:serine hydrolase domain-containing protein [Acidimicrobiales bacterium]